MQFEGEIATIQRRLAQCRDMVTRRSTVLARVNLQPGETVLEIGCGGGFYAREAGISVGRAGSVAAVDISAEQIAEASSHCAGLRHVECRVADVVALPYQDNSFDAAYGVQVLEYISAADDALREVCRVLRPVGRFVYLATNWDSVVWCPNEPDILARIERTWAGMLQHPNFPAGLPARLKQAGFRTLRQTPVTILNTTFDENTFSYWLVQMVTAHAVGRNVLSLEDADSLIADLSALSEAGRYFYSATPVITEAVRAGVGHQG